MTSRILGCLASGMIEPSMVSSEFRRDGKDWRSRGWNWNVWMEIVSPFHLAQAATSSAWADKVTTACTELVVRCRSSEVRDRLSGGSLTHRGMKKQVI